MKHARKCIRKQEEWQPHQYLAAISNQESVVLFYFSLKSLPSQSHHLNCNRMWWVEVTLQLNVFSLVKQIVSYRFAMSELFV